MNGNHQDGNFREKSVDPPGDVESVQIRHLEIQQDHVRRIVFHALQRFSSVSSLVANLPGALLLEQSPQVVPNRRVVVYHKNSNQAAPSSLWAQHLASEPGPTIATRSDERFNVLYCGLLLYVSSAPFVQRLPWPGHRSVRNAPHFL